MVSRQALSSRLFGTFNILLLLLLVVLCIYPFYYIFIYSVSVPDQVSHRQIYLWPSGFTLINYRQIFGLDELARAAFISAARTIAGTAVTVFCTSMYAYALTKPQLRFRKTMYRITLATMYVSAGIIPWYITMKAYGLKDNFLLYVLPTAIIAFYLVLIKTYFEQLPAAMEESAMIDGANVMTIFLRIVLPLSLPVLAVAAIFSAVNQWNTWTDNFFLAPNLPTMQLVLLNFLTDQTSNLMALKTNMATVSSSDIQQVTPTSIRMTITMIATLPIVFVYPFFQRYFISGIMIGAVKG
ncbi:carbohydrate ABC transporter permease [Cohnella fermenti]|uniref:Carbohydrate ABC transporter permease n=1 Tax=Cohnella fermenti TaxID=2565925 RepID=A0A4S4BKJ0_9BACL|nr:carbohydrate ABC transporter permease [Cohnella fermenti]THF75250.1 carbohydrate ABC transporter permease [Cohnella fermenti]